MAALPSSTRPTPRQPAAAPVRRGLAFRLAHKQPVVDIAQRVGHEGLALVVPPLAIHNELILVVAAAEQAGGVGRQHAVGSAGSSWPGSGKAAGNASLQAAGCNSQRWEFARRSPRRQVHHHCKRAGLPVHRLHGHRLHPSREGAAQVYLRKQAKGAAQAAASGAVRTVERQRRRHLQPWPGSIGRSLIDRSTSERHAGSWGSGWGVPERAAAAKPGCAHLAAAKAPHKACRYEHGCHGGRCAPLLCRRCARSLPRTAHAQLWPEKDAQISDVGIRQLARCAGGSEAGLRHLKAGQSGLMCAQA